jgi:hypothetical protein
MRHVVSQLLSELAETCWCDLENIQDSKSLNKSHDHVDLYFLTLFSLLVSFFHVLPTAGPFQHTINAYDSRERQGHHQRR